MFKMYAIIIVMIIIVSFPDTLGAVEESIVQYHLGVEGGFSGMESQSIAPMGSMYLAATLLKRYRIQFNITVWDGEDVTVIDMEPMQDTYYYGKAMAGISLGYGPSLFEKFDFFYSMGLAHYQLYHYDEEFIRVNEYYPAMLLNASLERRLNRYLKLSMSIALLLDGSFNPVYGGAGIGIIFTPFNK